MVLDGFLKVNKARQRGGGGREGWNWSSGRPELHQMYTNARLGKVAWKIWESNCLRTIRIDLNPIEIPLKSIDFMKDLLQLCTKMGSEAPQLAGKMGTLFSMGHHNASRRLGKTSSSRSIFESFTQQFNFLNIMFKYNII